MTNSEALKYLKEKDKECTTLSNIEAVLSWDMETVMPVMAEEGRADQMTYIALLSHKIKTDERYIFFTDNINLLVSKE